MFIHSTVIVVLFSSAMPTKANTRIRGEFEYDLDKQSLSEWQIGPVFTLTQSDDIELEVPIGQNDNVWQIQPELTYKVDLNDITLELSFGTEFQLDGERPQPFGSLEGSVDF